MSEHSNPFSSSSTLEIIESRHRKELKDLQSRITQRRKQATKKTRRGINDEIEKWQRDIKERHESEIAALNTAPDDNDPPMNPTNTGSHDEISTSTSTSTSTTEPLQRKRKPNRARARIARRVAEQEALIAQAASEAAEMPDQRLLERTAMAEHIERLGLAERAIRPDGHCLYSAVADQTTQPDYRAVRRLAAAYMLSHADDFVPFLDTPDTIDAYAARVADSADWGGHLELVAIARALGLVINVLQSDGRVERIECENKENNQSDLWLAYYRHSFGLGEHYNSLRKSD